MMGKFCACGYWVLKNMANMNKEMNFRFYLISINLTSGGYMCLAATVLDSSILKDNTENYFHDLVQEKIF